MGDWGHEWQDELCVCEHPAVEHHFSWIIASGLRLTEECEFRDMDGKWCQCQGFRRKPSV
jgi:hypothetical protein